MRIEAEGVRLRIDVGEEGNPVGNGFLHEVLIRICGMFEGWEGDVLIYNPTFFSLQANARHLRYIREVAEKYGFAISEEAMQVFDDTKKKAKEEMKKWEEERFQKWKEEEYQKWQNLKKCTQST